MRMSRAYAALLIGALIVHAVIVLAAVKQAFDSPARDDYDVWEFVGVIAIAFALAWAAVEVWKHNTRAVAALTLIVAAAALLTPGAVALVGLMLLNAYVVGERLLRWADPDPGSEIATMPFVAVALVGWAAWLGLISLTATLRVHFQYVYVVALVLPMLVWWRRTASLLADARRELARSEHAPRATERVWIALLLTIAIVHLFVVAKPDVGYDANAVHMQFAQLFADRHRWSYDFSRYAWAVMPLGADFAFASSFILGGGEQAARLLNLVFGAVALRIVYELIRRYASREVALASTCLVASTPLAFLETGSLFVDNLWCAFLLGALLLGLDYARTRAWCLLTAIAVLAAGALQTKAIAVVWLAPLTIAIAWYARSKDAARFRWPAPRTAVVMATAAVIAIYPYANAWARTGNPLFPFFNNVFRSPYFDAGSFFANPLYNAHLRLDSIYSLFLTSSKFIEGAKVTEGAAGFHWLLLLPLVALAFMRRRPVAQWLCLALAVIFFIAVYSQQAYLRYLLPFLLLFAALGGWALADIMSTHAARAALLLVGGTLVLVHLRFMHTSSWPNATLCTGCALDQSARSKYIATYLPDRIMAMYLNDTLRSARIGFFVLNAPGASGYLGYSRAANWHDSIYWALLATKSGDDVFAIARHYGLTHVVVLDSTQDPAGPLAEFRDRHTVPLWSFHGLVVAAVNRG